MAAAGQASPFRPPLIRDACVAGFLAAVSPKTKPGLGGPDWNQLRSASVVRVPTDGNAGSRRRPDRPSTRRREPGMADLLPRRGDDRRWRTWRALPKAPREEAGGSASCWGSVRSRSRAGRWPARAESPVWVAGFDQLPPEAGAQVRILPGGTLTRSFDSADCPRSTGNRGAGRGVQKGMRRGRIFSMVLAGALVLGACGGGSDREQRQDRPSPSTAASDTPGPSGRIAFDHFDDVWTIDPA